MSFEEITREAAQLSRRQRLALAGVLLELDDYSDDPQIEAAWEQVDAFIKLSRQELFFRE